MSAPLSVIAMHGWAGDARCWKPWQAATSALGWTWQCGERGYGAITPCLPVWDDAETGASGRLVIGHSLGPHLLPAKVLQQADAIVLLASFAAFVPPGRSGRRIRAALSGMAANLDNEERTRSMLKNFLTKVAEPQSPEALPPGPVDGPITGVGRDRLREDLTLLARCEGLPEGFPRQAQVLIVEAEEDRIVEPEARILLREALPQADVIALSGVGHALLAVDVIGRVVEWVEAARFRGGSGGPALPATSTPG